VQGWIGTKDFLPEAVSCGCWGAIRESVSSAHLAASSLLSLLVRRSTSCYTAPRPCFLCLTRVGGRHFVYQPPVGYSLQPHSCGHYRNWPKTIHFNIVHLSLDKVTTIWPRLLPTGKKGNGATGETRSTSNSQTPCPCSGEQSDLLLYLQELMLISSSLMPYC